MHLATFAITAKSADDPAGLRLNSSPNREALFRLFYQKPNRTLGSLSINAKNKEEGEREKESMQKLTYICGYEERGLDNNSP